MAETFTTNFKYLKQSGFSEQQIEALLRLNKEQIEKQAITKKDISIIKKDIELIKKDLMIWLGSFVVGGVMFSCTYLTWFFNYLDNKTRFHGDARVESLKGEMSARIEGLKGETNAQFDNMKIKLNGIKNDIKELKDLYKK